MKIVDRKTFMRMPKGTVFCKFPRFNEATRSYGYSVLRYERGRIEVTGIFKSPQGDVTEPEKMVVED